MNESMDVGQRLAGCCCDKAALSKNMADSLWQLLLELEVCLHRLSRRRASIVMGDLARLLNGIAGCLTDVRVEEEDEASVGEDLVVSVDEEETSICVCLLVRGLEKRWHSLGSAVLSYKPYIRSHLNSPQDVEAAAQEVETSFAVLEHSRARTIGRVPGQFRVPNAPVSIKSLRSLVKWLEREYSCAKGLLTRSKVVSLVS